MVPLENDPMFTIFKDFQFSAAHLIRGHRGECRFLHGHNYRVRVHLGARQLDAIGMVVDFAELKELVSAVVGPFDHRNINEIPPFDERNTTAELVSQYVFDEVDRRLEASRGDRVWVRRVEVWENDTACAVYEPDDRPRGER